VHLLFALHTYDRDLDNGAIKYDLKKTAIQARRFVLSYQKIKHEFSTTRKKEAWNFYCMKKESMEYLLQEKRNHGFFVRTKKEYLIFPLHEK
jgi:hypothetical protein